jgi:hypothetical protein
MKLNLGLDNGKRRVETQIEGDNVAQMMQQMPELLNTMLRHLTLEQDIAADRALLKQHGVTYEQQDGEETALVRQSAGVDDAEPSGQREGGVKPSSGV